ASTPMLPDGSYGPWRSSGATTGRRSCSRCCSPSRTPSPPRRWIGTSSSPTWSRPTSTASRRTRSGVAGPGPRARPEGAAGCGRPFAEPPRRHGSVMPEHRVPITRLTWLQFRRAVSDFANCEVGWRARGLFALLIALLFAFNGLNVLNSYVGRDFMTAIANRDWARFTREAIAYLGVFAASASVAAFYSFSEQRLGLLWREWLTRRLLGAYLDDRAYYSLSAP